MALKNNVLNERSLTWKYILYESICRAGSGRDKDNLCKEEKNQTSDCFLGASIY